MAEFAYNNAKNTNMGYTPFENKYGYHLHVFYKKNANPCSRFKVAHKLIEKLRNLKVIYRENL